MSVHERFVVLGLAPVRREWFREVARWSNEAAIPVEFVKCVSASEVAARLGSGTPFSALLVDGAAAGLDRDLLDLAREHQCATVIVDHGLVDRDWSSLGASGVLPERFDGRELVGTLEECAQPIGRTPTTARRITDRHSTERDRSESKLVAVTGGGGVGTSTIAMALAQGLAARNEPGAVALADMALRASQALMHDARDVVPGLTEFIESHRLGTPSDDEISHMIHDLPDRGYHLLLGLRHDRDWVSIGARALDAAHLSLARRYEITVCDVTGDFDGSAETGAHDLDDRNRLARTAVLQADVVVAVGGVSTWALHHLVRTVLQLLEIGVEPGRILPVVNRGPRQPRARSEITSAVANLLEPRSSDASVVPTPIFVPERKQLDAIIRDGAALPTTICDPVAQSVGALLSRRIDQPRPTDEPVAIAPGSLGGWDVDD